jgi:hypothetical protein
MISAEILEIPPAAAPYIVQPEPASATWAAADLAPLFRLNPLPARRRPVLAMGGRLTAGPGSRSHSEG